MEKKQMITVCYAVQAPQTIQPLLDEGWKVVFMSAEIVSHAGNGGMDARGQIIFVLEKVN